MVDSVLARLQTIREKMERAAALAGRDPRHIQLVAVSKNHGVDEMLPFVNLPIDAFGENRVQEALAKREAWPLREGPPWRLIGHLQRNKARRALDVFDTVDSLDSPVLARHLEKILAETGRVLPVLIEVNTSGEAAKHGTEPEALSVLVETILTECPHLCPEGLMTVGPLSMEEIPTRRAFTMLRRLRDEAAERFDISLVHLSMGMSGDFEWAIHEGSTMIRVGTALFGPRKG